jgi:ribonuclease J
MEKHYQNRNQRFAMRGRNKGFNTPYPPSAQIKTNPREIRTFIADKEPLSIKKSSPYTQLTGRGISLSNRGMSTSPVKNTLRRKTGSQTERRSSRSHSRPHRQSIKSPRTTESAKNFKDIPPPLGDTVRIIPLGGVEEIGRNMTVIEYKNDIVVIDAGLQFSEEDTPGIDYILPNTKYLEERKSKIRALLVTHGHLDHIGGIPYIMGRIGNPPIYTRKLTALMIEKRQAEFPDNNKLDIRIIDKNEAIKIGDLKIRFFGVTHTIPDCMGIIIETPYGMIVTPGDFKLSHTNEMVDPKEEEEYSIFEKEKVLLLMADSTNIANPGFSTPERLVHKTLEDIIGNSTGRLIIGTFSSQFERMIKIIQVAEAIGKKIVVEGRSMKTNIDIAIAAGLISPKNGTIIPAEEMENYPPEKIVMLATGAQGEDFAALMRMTNKSHKTVQIKK